MPIKQTLIAMLRCVFDQSSRDFANIGQSIDFLQTFPALAEQLYKNQPPFNAPNVWKWVVSDRSLEQR